jgi:hypothetical protein
LVAIFHSPYQNGLENTVLLDGIGKFLERCLVEDFPRLIGVRINFSYLYRLDIVLSFRRQKRA